VDRVPSEKGVLGIGFCEKNFTRQNPMKRINQLPWILLHDRVPVRKLCRFTFIIYKSKNIFFCLISFVPLTT
jgi:hypothetical protein